MNGAKNAEKAEAPPEFDPPLFPPTPGFDESEEGYLGLALVLLLLLLEFEKEGGVLRSAEDDLVFGDWNDTCGWVWV